MPLAFLAAAVVEAISKGSQAPALTTERLTRGVNLPFDWSAQLALLGPESLKEGR